ncbi:MAG: hypothetical protein EKK55_17330 [Rhodocyclaceae bacterium]|nr:MAG: hypothetical protein EKK55_17330 [Rhodocyclaceae bacterium]
MNKFKYGKQKQFHPIIAYIPDELFEAFEMVRGSYAPASMSRSAFVRHIISDFLSRREAREKRWKQVESSAHQVPIK